MTKLAIEVQREYQRQLWDENWRNPGPRYSDSQFHLFRGNRVGLFYLDVHEEIEEGRLFTKCGELDGAEILDDKGKVKQAETKARQPYEGIISDDQWQQLKSALEIPDLMVVVVLSDVPLLWETNMGFTIIKAENPMKYSTKNWM